MTTPTLHDSEDGAKVKSLHKALGLLDYFTIDKTELGVTELAQKSGMLKSSVSNILSTFEQSGIVERNPATGKYHLGLKIMALSNLIYLNNDLRRVSRPVLERIADICQETVYLAKMYDMTQIIYLDSIFPRGNSGGKNLIGLRVPAYCTGLGKTLLAYQPPEYVDAVARAGMPRYTENTICDPGALRRELERIRRRGYGIDNIEHEKNLRCVSLPLHNSEGAVVAAISLSGPPMRFTDEKIEEYAYTIRDQISGLDGLLH